MPTIELDRNTHERLSLLARAWETTEAQAVGRLLSKFMTAGRQEASDGGSEVPIHAVYKGVRSEGLFDLNTGAIRLTEGPLAGRAYDAPSRAATAFVHAVNPKVVPNRNGWGFWLVTATGKTLQSIRP